jgi:hypothetical protein
MQTTTRPDDTTASTACARRPHVGRVAAVAMTGAALIWTLATAARVDLEVRQGSSTTGVTLAAVIVTAMLATILGASLLRLLERRTPRGRQLWTVVASTVWALSFLGPLSATHPSAGLVLASLHLFVGAVVVVGLRRTRGTSARVA